MISSCQSTVAEKPVQSPNTIPVPSMPIPADQPAKKETLDTNKFNKLQLYLVHNKPSARWPVKTAYPLPGALLPFKRIVAYYGNFYSKGMGILGELQQEEMLRRLEEEVKNWQQADTMIPALPALHYIAVTAQRKPGADGKYRLRMPFQQIDLALKLAKQLNAILILDVQVGHSTLEEELPKLEPYLKLPNVHLGIDPEYSMKGGEIPCSTIGTFDAGDVNYAASYLAALVQKNSIPPKVLIVHRFTKEMVTNYKNILTRPEVQIVVNMDGFGFPAKKISSYKTALVNEPVQFTGFKIFYKNDKLSKPYRLMQPTEILELTPAPIYIQYQ